MTTTTRVPALGAEGWFTTDPDRPALLGLRCTTCGTYVFPRADHGCPNPACAGTDLDEVEHTLGDYPTFVIAYRRYWEHLAQSTHNPVLAYLSPALRAIVDSGGFVPDEVYRQATLERLRTVHSAVSDHDGPAAWRAMRDLELEFHARLTTGYPRQMERVVAWSDLDIEP